jgi:hypothetical protein
MTFLPVSEVVAPMKPRLVEDMAFAALLERAEKIAKTCDEDQVRELVDAFVLHKETYMEDDDDDDAIGRFVEKMGLRGMGCVLTRKECRSSSNASIIKLVARCNDVFCSVLSNDPQKSREQLGISDLVDQR